MATSSPPGSLISRAASFVGQGASSQQLRSFMASQGYPMSGQWCGEFTAAVIKSVGGQPVSGSAWADNWQKFGTSVDRSQLKPGDSGVITFGGHVGLFSVDDQGNIREIGGNQRLRDSQGNYLPPNQEGYNTPFAHGVTEAQASSFSHMGRGQVTYHLLNPNGAIASPDQVAQATAAPAAAAYADRPQPTPAQQATAAQAGGPPPQAPAGSKAGLLQTLLNAESYGGRNVPNITDRGPGVGGGYFQIRDATWARYAKQAGVDLSAYPTALKAPYAIQAQVASVIPMGQFGSRTLNLIRGAGYNVDPSQTLGQNLAMVGESLGPRAPGGPPSRDMLTFPAAGPNADQTVGGFGSPPGLVAAPSGGPPPAAISSPAGTQKVSSLGDVPLRGQSPAFLLAGQRTPYGNMPEGPGWSKFIGGPSGVTATGAAAAGAQPTTADLTAARPVLPRPRPVTPVAAGTPTGVYSPGAFGSPADLVPGGGRLTPSPAPGFAPHSLGPYITGAPGRTGVSLPIAAGTPTAGYEQAPRPPSTLGPEEAQYFNGGGPGIAFNNRSPALGAAGAMDLRGYFGSAYNPARAIMGLGQPAPTTPGAVGAAAAFARPDTFTSNLTTVPPNAPALTRPPADFVPSSFTATSAGETGPTTPSALYQPLPAPARGVSDFFNQDSGSQPGAGLSAGAYPGGPPPQQSLNDKWGVPNRVASADPNYLPDVSGGGYGQGMSTLDPYAAHNPDVPIRPDLGPVPPNLYNNNPRDNAYPQPRDLSQYAMLGGGAFGRDPLASVVAPGPYQDPGLTAPKVFPRRIPSGPDEGQGGGFYPDLQPAPPAPQPGGPALWGREAVSPGLPVGYQPGDTSMDPAIRSMIEHAMTPQGAPVGPMVASNDPFAGMSGGSPPAAGPRQPVMGGASYNLYGEAGTGGPPATGGLRTPTPNQFGNYLLNLNGPPPIGADQNINYNVSSMNSPAAINPNAPANAQAPSAAPAYGLTSPSSDPLKNNLLTHQYVPVGPFRPQTAGRVIGSVAGGVGGPFGSLIGSLIGAMVGGGAAGTGTPYQGAVASRYTQNGMTPWGSPAYGPGGNYNSPFTPSGYTPPSYNTVSGGPTYAYGQDPATGQRYFINSAGNAVPYTADDRFTAGG